MRKRLETLVQWVRGPVIADIGCDHGLLDILAVSQGRAQKAYACDIAQGPLDRAVSAIQKAGMTETVIPVLCDGIPDFADIDQVIIAGMGAETIIHILETSPVRTDRMLLSPHSKDSLLRQYLTDHGSRIIRERTVKERDHFYPVMEVERGSQTLTPAQLAYGCNVLEDEDRRQFLQYEKNRLETLKARAPQAAEVDERLTLLRTLL